MTDLPLALSRLRAAVSGEDFEWEIDGGSPFDDAKALIDAYDELRAALQKISDLEDGSRGSYGKFAAAKSIAKTALTS